MRPRFQPDAEADGGAKPSAVLFDPEAFDATEQQFAASLEPTAGRFVVDAQAAGQTGVQPKKVEGETGPAPEEPKLIREHNKVGLASQSGPAEQGSESWRREVEARLNRYRARRHPREPRYPSLRLKFEAGEPARNVAVAASESPVAASRQAVALDPMPSDAASLGPHPSGAPAGIAETNAKIIEFRRFAAPPLPLEELAEPVLARPRILEAPEIATPDPALGGILIESPEEPPPQRRPGFEIPLQPAAMARRLAATAMDAALVSLAFAGFVYLFLRITATVPPLPQTAAAVAGLIGFFWVSYQYLMLVRCGITPGLRLAKLRLSRFDGSPVPRRLRGWRVLASILSAASLGLGYAWCFFDEDQLCWHDRITRTYMAPNAASGEAITSPR